MLWRGQLHTNKTQRNRYGKQIRDKFYHIYQVVPNVDNEVGNKGLIWARFFFRPRTAKYDNAPRYSWIDNSFRYSWSNSVRILRQYPGGSYVFLNILTLKLQFLFSTIILHFLAVNKSRYGSFQCGTISRLKISNAFCSFCRSILVVQDVLRLRKSLSKRLVCFHGVAWCNQIRCVSHSIQSVRRWTYFVHFWGVLVLQAVLRRCLPVLLLGGHRSTFHRHRSTCHRFTCHQQQFQRCPFNMV